MPTGGLTTFWTKGGAVSEGPTISPAVRQGIVISLTLITIGCIAAEVVIAKLGINGGEALLTIAATAVGGLAGMAVPKAGG